MTFGSLKIYAQVILGPLGEVWQVKGENKKSRYPQNAIPRSRRWQPGGERRARGRIGRISVRCPKESTWRRELLGSSMVYQGRMSKTPIPSIFDPSPDRFRNPIWSKLWQRWSGSSYKLLAANVEWIRIWKSSGLLPVVFVVLSYMYNRKLTLQ